MKLVTVQEVKDAAAERVRAMIAEGESGIAVILDLPSRSRKKRRQIGAYVPHRKAGEPRRERNAPHPKSTRRADRKRRKAMGARGVKTNSLCAGRN